MGQSAFPLNIPNSVKLVGVEAHVQHWARDKKANSAGLVTSIGAAIKIGG